MNNIVCHIIGLDEIHKKKLIKHLPNHIKPIDLDKMQQMVYNDTDIIKQKLIWQQISKDILIRRKQKNLIGSKKIVSKNFDKDIKKMMTKRNMVRQNIHYLWKTKMTNNINKYLRQYRKDNILFLGFNIFPKDYRIRINIELPPNSLNKIIFDIKPNIYSANQIKFYLTAYSDRIIKGTFPLNLLKIDYLSEKYEKFTRYYEKLQYAPVNNESLMSTINKLDKQLVDIKKISGKNIFIATLYKSGDTIPVNTKTPIEGFLTKEAAINNIRQKLKKYGPIYLYEIKAEQFSMVDGKLIAVQPLYPIREESFLLSQNNNFS